MANVTQNDYNLVDVTKSLAPDQKSFLNTVNLIAKKNDFLDDVRWEEGIGLTSHLIGQIVSMPDITESADNQGYGTGKDEVINVDEFACEIGSNNPIDVRTLMRSPNPREFRSRKDDSHIVAHGEKLVERVFSGNRKTNPLQIDGLYNRNFWAGSISSNGAYQLSAGGISGADMFDAWVIRHGEDAFKMWYPRGSKAGINIEDKGELPVLDAAGKMYFAQVTHFDWKFGLGIYDPRNIVRVSNIKPSDSAQKLEETLVRAINRMRGENDIVIYLPSEVYTQLDILAMNKTNAVYTKEDVFGRKVTTFRGVPVRKVEFLDSLKYTTART